ncbi:MAG: adenosylmethionine--8-amino-7-oxononanoate transaminase [Dissulfurimicrobium sp.]|uniref:adenosylmethionine--8-amino-7-oxononanoate transaminase n=1 Tax=Dissulfurimicrobium TaxID=1769732 RepID=UPI001ED9FB44|nr:adenosylmethionine--8-amino-7-oxononanoate transaminase [Dissulfurimicrobium hydrothermale]UKL13385.1 adenosylmethionine--8-amino-7-oxononanoate transaminase [Dissulfurimicrobium hydrothermale]
MDIVEKDKRFLWHPYTQMKDLEKVPLLFVDHADGVFLYDRDGTAYYDCISSWWCIVHGHNHPYINAAIKAQLGRLEQVHFAGTTHEGAIKLAERLVGITPPNLTRVFYSDNGSTACEVALKMSFQYWKQAGHPERERFVALDRGYHGDTIGTMSVGGTGGFHSIFSPLFFKTHRLPSPYCYRCVYEKPCADDCTLECLSPLETLLDEGGIAAIILEPLLQAAGGMIVYPVKYLKKLANLAKAYGAHLILDEVATGFGRTGRMFALEHAGIEPDFLCLSKGITGGYLPMAATLTTEEVFQVFYDDYEKGKTFFHGHTFTANPLAVAAALASLDVFEQEMVLEKTADKIAFLQREKERARDIPIVGDIRGIGMVAAFELVEDKATKRPFDPKMRMGWLAYMKGLKKGLIIRPLGDIIYLFLPLSVTIGEIRDILDRLFSVLSSLEAKT